MNYITDKQTELFIKRSYNRFEVEVNEKGNDRASTVNSATNWTTE